MQSQFEKFQSFCKSHNHFFPTILALKVLPASRANSPVMICCHGYGADNQISDSVRWCSGSAAHSISFNFPDFNCVAKSYDPKKSSFGSIQELLPLLYILKRCVIDAELPAISLYGFSAGGGAVINALAVLNHDRYDAQLYAIGISGSCKHKILAAIAKGAVILDCPLKSIEEVMDMRGKSSEFMVLAQRYKQNGLQPIDSLERLTGLSLTVLVYFEKNDDMLGNRDDTIFIDRLQTANQGTTHIITGSDGGHNGCHRLLWQKYKKIVNLQHLN